jgi:hypothetical protein
MNSELNEILKQQEEEQLRTIIDREDLSPEELWKLQPTNYKKWCNKNYYPKLINYFCNHYPSFSSWMTEYQIDLNFLLEYGISKCIAPKRYKGNKRLYIVDCKHKDFSGRFISYKKLNETKILFDSPGIYKTIKTFISYSDWCARHNIKMGLFNIHSRTAPGHKYEEVLLDGNFKLLKMGGIELHKSKIHRDMELEFVNLCSFKISGKSYLDPPIQLTCWYSTVDYLDCSETDLSIVDFNFCSMENIRIVNSHIQQWQFYDCKVQGKIRNTDLILIKVFGGKFYPVFKEVNINDFRTEEIDKASSRYMLSIYNSLKKIYSDQGQDRASIIYFIREKDIERRFSKWWRRYALTVSWLYWGYGRRPSRVIYFSIFFVLFFSFAFFFLPNDLIRYHSSLQPLPYWDCLYTSFSTFVTLGFADVEVFGFTKFLVGLEAFLGALSMGFLVAGFSNFKY